MSDPWDRAAQRITGQKAERHRREAEAEQTRLRKEAEKRQAAEKSYAEMQAAIAAAAPLLEAFLVERGAAAQRLLAACGERAHIMFGAQNEGGYYHSVFLHADGLREEMGTAGGYSATPQSNKPTTALAAVEAFARHGVGRGNPQQVRNIVDWLTRQIDGYSRA
jgi:hypothetical protein